MTRCKKAAVWCAALLFLTGALSGCGQSAAGREAITISGSSSVFPVIDGLKELFMERHTDIHVQVEQGGSGVGIANVRDGFVDIGMSSRNLKEEEKPLREAVLCLDGIAVVINRENPVKDLTVEQIAGIYRGEITNWAQVGGRDAAITLITREATSGTRGAFEEMVLDKQIIDDRLCLVQNSTGNVGIAVEYDRNAIGYMSLGVVDHFAGLKAAAVGGVAASQENMRSGAYPLTRSYLLLTKGEPEGAVKTFLDYVTGDEEALEFIRDAKYVLQR